MPIDPFGKVRPRRPSLKNAMMADVTRGAERVRVWPGPRGKPKTTAEAERQEFFRQTQLAIKYMPAIIQAQYREACKGTALLPRDLLTMTLYGRFNAIMTDDGRKLYPMTARMDISESLDVLCQVANSLLYRGAQYWEGVPAGTALQFLRMNAAGDGIAWQDIAPGSGLNKLFEQEFAVDTPTFDTGILPFVGGEMIASLSARGTAASEYVDVRYQFNGVTTASYDSSRFNNYGALQLANVAYMEMGSLPGAFAIANGSGAVEVKIPNWQGATFNKAAVANGYFVGSNASGAMISQTGGGDLRDTAPITSMQIHLSAGDFAAGSKLTVWAMI